jgi:hypothetical protein
VKRFVIRVLTGGRAGGGMIGGVVVTSRGALAMRTTDSQFAADATRSRTITLDRALAHDPSGTQIAPT